MTASLLGLYEARAVPKTLQFCVWKRPERAPLTAQQQLRQPPIFNAIRRASSLVSSLAAARRLVLEIDIRKLLAVGVTHDAHN
jgi:hypothetical protein